MRWSGGGRSAAEYRSSSVARAMLLTLWLGIFVAAGAAAETVYVEMDSSTQYRINTTDPGLGTTWTTAGFDDVTWATGTFGVGYESVPLPAEDLLRTVVSVNSKSVYTRTHFNVTDAGAVQGLHFGCDYDDGCVAWLNGVEIYRSTSMPAGSPDWNSVPTEHESSNGDFPVYEIVEVPTAGLNALVTGDNVLAVGVWNAAQDDDLILVPLLVADRALSLVRGPYLQQGTDTTVTLRWRTSIPTPSEVS
ncbi:MAG: hypothetical protein GY716_10475 [bacterium]|nr:hypothetical protein [bacterium]